MVNRIRQLLDWQQLSPTQFADLIGVGRPVVSHILSERNKPSLEVVQRIIAALPAVSLPWLLSGTGEMLSSAASSSAAAPITAPVAAPSPAAVKLEPALPKAPAVRPVSVPRPANGSLPAMPGRFVKANPTTTAEPVTLEAASVTHTRPTLAAPPLPVASSVSAFQLPNALPIRDEPPIASVSNADAMPGQLRMPTLPPPSFSSPATMPQPANTAAVAAALGEPGKAIRRIVLFYQDGSFTDYRPEN